MASQGLVRCIRRGEAESDQVCVDLAGEETSDSSSTGQVGSAWSVKQACSIAEPWLPARFSRHIQEQHTSMCLEVFCFLPHCFPNCPLLQTLSLVMASASDTTLTCGGALAFHKALRVRASHHCCLYHEQFRCSSWFCTMRLEAKLHKLSSWLCLDTSTEWHRALLGRSPSA